MEGKSVHSPAEQIVTLSVSTKISIVRAERMEDNENGLITKIDLGPNYHQEM